MVGVSTTPPPKCKEPFLKHVEKVVFGMKGGRAFTSFRNEFKHKAFARVGMCAALSIACITPSLRAGLSLCWHSSDETGRARRSIAHSLPSDRLGYAARHDNQGLCKEM